MQQRDNTPIVMRGKLGDKTTYARIPIRNRYPLPNEEIQHKYPVEAIRLLAAHAGFELQCYKEFAKPESLALAEQDLKEIQHIISECEVHYL